MYVYCYCINDKHLQDIKSSIATIAQFSKARVALNCQHHLYVTGITNSPSFHQTKSACRYDAFANTEVRLVSTGQPRVGLTTTHRTEPSRVFTSKSSNLCFGMNFLFADKPVTTKGRPEGTLFHFLACASQVLNNIRLPQHRELSPSLRVHGTSAPTSTIFSFPYALAVTLDPLSCPLKTSKHYV